MIPTITKITIKKIKIIMKIIIMIIIIIEENTKSQTEESTQKKVRKTDEWQIEIAPVGHTKARRSTVCQHVARVACRAK